MDRDNTSNRGVLWTAGSARRTAQRIAVFTAALLLAGTVTAQKHQLGLGLGGFNYAGDLARGYPLGSLRPGGQISYRYNFSNLVSIKGGFTGGLLSGSDNVKPIDDFARQRQGSFQSTIVELSAVIEYNFIDYKDPKSLANWSPYLFLGIAGFGAFGPAQTGQNTSPVQPAIPFGMGVKYQAGKRIELSFEAGLRKVFYDYLDGYSDGDRSVKNYQYGNKYDDDWYNYVGFSIHYTLFYIPCPYDFY